MTTLKNWFRNFRVSFQGIDLLLLLTVLGLLFFGLLMVYSSSFIFAQEKTGDGFGFIRRQVLYAILGFGALSFGLRLNYRRWEKWAYPVLGFAVFLLAIIFVPGIGERVGGARRWLGFGGLRFQPAELAKFAMIVFVARQLHMKQERLHTLTGGVLSLVLAPLPVLILLLMQPDFGSTVVIGVVVFSMMFVAGVPSRYLGGVLGAGMAISGWLVLSSSYRRSRLIGYLDPWQDPGGKGFQILQSLIGIHNGGVSGVGLGNGKEKLFFLPEAHNDFIFSVIGEETGFIGISCVILVYLFFVYRGLKIGWSCYVQRQDRFGMLLATGITIALGFQGFVNIAVVLGLLPTKGLTLPFISYGGSALLVDLFAVGVLLSVGKGHGTKT